MTLRSGSGKVSIGVICLGMMLALAACDDAPPTGQVVATIGDTDVTRREVALELQQLTVAGDDGYRRRFALNTVIDRAMLVRAAKRRNVDTSPEYLGQMRRMREILLSEMLADQLASDLVEPTREQIAAFTAANPLMFAERANLLVDEVIATGRPNAADQRQLQGAVTIDDAARVLTHGDRPIRRLRRTLDSATLPAALARRLIDSRDGQPILAEVPDAAWIIAVVAREPIPVVGEPAVRLARDAIRRQQLDVLLKRLITAERKRTPIRFQSGWGLAAR